MNTGLWLETLTPLSKYLKDKIDKKSTRMEENTPVLSLAGSLYIYGTLPNNRIQVYFQVSMKHLQR